MAVPEATLTIVVGQFWPEWVVAGSGADVWQRLSTQMLDLESPTGCSDLAQNPKIHEAA